MIEFLTILGLVALMVPTIFQLIFHVGLFMGLQEGKVPDEIAPYLTTYFATLGVALFFLSLSLFMRFL